MESVEELTDERLIQAVATEMAAEEIGEDQLAMIIGLDTRVVHRFLAGEIVSENAIDRFMDFVAWGDGGTEASSCGLQPITKAQRERGLRAALPDIQRTGSRLAATEAPTVPMWWVSLRFTFSVKAFGTTLVIHRG